MKSMNRKRGEDTERADRFHVHAEARHVAHDLSADRIENRRDDNHAACDGEDGRVLRRIQMRLEPNIRKRRDIADGAGIDRCHGCEQRKTVDPADEPTVTWSYVVLAVLVERA